MTKTNKLPMKVLIICLCLAGISLAAKDEMELYSPIVGDWPDAVNRNGHVRIPLQNPKGHAWFVALRMGTPIQYE